METLTGILFSIFFGFAPMLLFASLVFWTDRYEKEPLLLLGLVFLWGAIVAAGGAFVINTAAGIGVYLFTQSESFTILSTGSAIAPLVEELLKGFAVLLVFIIFRREFDSILDGIVYAAIAGLGFAATENAYYIYKYGIAEEGITGGMFMVFIRVILVGWQHPFYTAFIGIGLAIARFNQSWLIKIIVPLIGLALAVFTHSFHNTLAALLGGTAGLVLGTIIDWSGWLVMGLFILWALYREQRWITAHLQEEVSLGTINPHQYRTACSAWAQAAARSKALFNQRYRITARFYQIAAELAYKKEQRLKMGEEGDNSPIIERLRTELSSLAPQVLA
jgi:RsiW-degrading membrane proteinase PrsW (M82 family)